MKKLILLTGILAGAPAWAMMTGPGGSGGGNELIAAFVSQPSLSQADQKALEARLAVARAAGARIEILEGEDPVSAIVDFADARGITQLFIGHSQRSTLRARLFGNPVDRLIDRSRGMDVRIFPQ